MTIADEAKKAQAIWGGSVGLAKSLWVAPGSNAMTELDQAIANIQNGSSSSGGSSSSNSDPEVWWVAPHTGATIVGQEQDALDPSKTHKYGGVKLKASEVLDKWYTDDGFRENLMQEMYQAGLISKPGAYDEALNQWKNVVQEAAQYTAAGRNVDLWDVMDRMAGLSGTKNGPASTTSTSTQTNVVTQAAAEQWVKQIWQSEMGRDPTPAEMSSWASQIIAQSKANPSVTKTTITDGNRTDVTTGGFGSADAQDFLQRAAQNDPEYGAHQAATTYFNQLMQAVGAIE